MLDRSSSKMIHDTDFEDFWLVYLRAHAHPTTRGLHYCAAGFGAGCVVIGVMAGTLWPLLIGAAGLCATVSVAHLLCEHNRAYLHVGGRPLWSLVCFCRMSASALLGHLREDLARAGL